MTRKSNLGDSGDYEVGYGKPPRETQFKPGRSGNPLGRLRLRKDAEPAFDVFRKVFNQKIRIRVDGKLQYVPLREAALKQLAARAATGDASSIKEMIKIETMMAKLEREQGGGPEEKIAVFAIDGLSTTTRAALAILDMVQTYDPRFQTLKPWVVKAALERLGRELTEHEANVVREALYGRDRKGP
jgi:hypothetical protein